MTRPTVDLAICTFGRAETVVSSLERSRPELGAFERILVIDNNPDGMPDAARAKLRACGADIVHEPEVGLSRARNRALRESRADVLWYIDDDASLRDGFADGVRRHLDRIAAMDTASRPVFGGGYILAASEVADVSVIGPFELSLLSCMSPSRPFPRPWGANMFVDRAVAAAAGGFDPALGWTHGTRGFLGEEDDLFVRMQRSVGEGRRTAYFADGCSVDHWVPQLRRRFTWLLSRAFKGGRSNYVLFRNMGKRELIRGFRQCAASPGRENVLILAFLMGKRFQRLRRRQTASVAAGAP